jgi:subtilisin family serine protease
MREYIITVKDPAVWDSGLWNELTVDGLGDNFIPGRSVEVLNERPFNEFMAHFNLTDEEAAQIRQDDRIAFVELQADLQEGVIKEHFGTRPTATYDKSGTTNATMKNWGLLRSSRPTNPFASSLAVSADFTYNLDGTGVDIIVVDSGVDQDHPEFAVNADGTGGSRVVDFNWASLGVPGTASAASIGGYLGDADGHGNHCAGIAAGNTHGWAPGAAIYSIRIFGSAISSKDPAVPGTSLYLDAINSDIAFDLVKAFHLAKRAAGNMRPTICTNSWGYRSNYSRMTATVYRGVTYPGSSPRSEYGQVNYLHPYIVNYLDVSATNCANAGVILVGAAGNYLHKIDVPDGPDYNNYYTGFYGTQYYHRGSSPTRAEGFITVGAIDNSTVEKKVYFSETGPRVDVYAAGTSIMSALSVNYASVSDPRNPTYRLGKISGTSMACPQVTGVLATVLQARPNMTPAEAKQFIIDSSVKNALVEGSSTAYTSTTYLQGGNNRVLQTPFTNPSRGSIRS